MDIRILDASAFYAGVPFASSASSYTTSLVYQEIKHIKRNYDALDAILDIKRLRIRDPNLTSITSAKEAAKATGDLPQLSKQDISIIALGIEMSGDIVTDDFAVSNVAKSLHLNVMPIMTRGITDQGRWVHYCPGCRTNHYSSNLAKGERVKVKSNMTTAFTDMVNCCPACGTRLKRKLLKNRHNKKKTN